MPARGDLRRQAHQIPNPFDEEPPRIQEYTAKEIAILQSRLEKQLGPEYISTRKGPGGQNVHYLGAEKIINLANEVFGFNGWSTSIRDTTIDYVDIDKDGRVSMGLSVVMRVTLRDGTFHEDVGYGMISNCSGKGAAFEKTKKEAATDAMKRALRNFGNVLGNCLYDKDYLKKVVKIEPPSSRWSEDNLHRHPDVVPRKQSNPETISEIPTDKASLLPPTRTMSEQSKVSGMTTDYDDEFGGNAFDDVDFTRSDEFIVHDTSALDGEVPEDIQVVPRQEDMDAAIRQVPFQRSHSVPQQRSQPNTGQRPPVPPPQAQPPIQQRPIVQSSAGLPGAQMPQGARPAPAHQNTNANAGQRTQGPIAQQRGTSSTPEYVQQRQAMQAPPNPVMPGGQQLPETPVGFVRGGVADMIQSANGQMPANAAFNPHTESLSIRKTNGVNHRTSAPIRREDIATTVAPAPTTNVGQGFAPPQMSHNPQTNGAVLPPAAPPAHANMPPAPSRANFINPQQDPHRRIGAPMHAGMQSPGARPGGYRPPGPAGQKRGPPNAIVPRSPLSDVSNTKQPPGDAGGGGGGRGDAKRMRVHGGQEGSTGPILAS